MSFHSCKKRKSVLAIDIKLNLAQTVWQCSFPVPHFSPVVLKKMLLLYASRRLTVFKAPVFYLAYKCHNSESLFLYTLSHISVPSFTTVIQ